MYMLLEDMLLEDMLLEDMLLEDVLQNEAVGMVCSVDTKDQF